MARYLSSNNPSVYAHQFCLARAVRCLTDRTEACRAGRCRGLPRPVQAYGLGENGGPAPASPASERTAARPPACQAVSLRHDRLGSPRPHTDGTGICCRFGYRARTRSSQATSETEGGEGRVREKRGAQERGPALQTCLQPAIQISILLINKTCGTQLTSTLVDESGSFTVIWPYNHPLVFNLLNPTSPPELIKCELTGLRGRGKEGKKRNFLLGVM